MCGFFHKAVAHAKVQEKQFGFSQRTYYKCDPYISLQKRESWQNILPAALDMAYAFGREVGRGSAYGVAWESAAVGCQKQETGIFRKRVLHERIKIIGY